MRTFKKTIDTYELFITEYNNQFIRLSKLLKERNINHLTVGWVESGVAIPQNERGLYKIISNNPRKDAIRILRLNQRYQEANRKKPTANQSKLLGNDKPSAIIEMGQTDKPKKKISILWGMISIEQ